MTKKFTEDDNKYGLLNYDQDSDNPDMSKTQEVTKAIDNLIKEFVVKYNRLAKKYPDSGIGDTATDEIVVDNIYGPLHFGEKV